MKKSGKAAVFAALLLIFLLTGILIYSKYNNSYNSSHNLYEDSSYTMDPEVYLDTTLESMVSDESWIEPDITAYNEISCVSDELVSLFGRSGLQLGICGGGMSDGECFHLSPSVNGGRGESYGVYVSCRYGTVTYNGSADADQAETAVFSAITYDTAVPAESCLYFPPQLYGWDNGIADSLYFRVIDLSDYSCAGVLSCDAVCEGNTVTLRNLHDADASASLPPDECRRLVFSAYDYITDPSKGPGIAIEPPDIDSVTDRAVIENSGLPHFPFLLDSDGCFLRSGLLSGMDTVAVSLPWPAAGSITVYLVPRLQAEGYSVSETFFIDKEYTAVGYDLLYPFSEDSLLIPLAAYDGYLEYISDCEVN